MSDTPGSFPCTQCGECCKKVHLLADTAALDRGDGICMHFDETHKQCRIYEGRPDICRIDRQFAQHYRLIMSWTDFVTLNEAGCKALQQSVDG